MKKIFFLFTCASLIVHCSLAQQPSWRWGRDAGGPGNDQGKAISTDVNGNSYVTGRFNATDTFGNFTVTSYGGPDIFLAKYDTYGSVLWVKHGGSYDVNDVYGDEGDGVDIDANGNAYITGNYYTQATFGPLTLTCPTAHRQIFVVKYDSTGNEIWAQQPTGSSANNYSRAIAVDDSGNSYITGYLGGGTNTFGAYSITGPGAFVVKYDSSGTVIFATHLATFGAIDAYGIAVDGWGNTYVTGYLQGTDSINGIAFTSTGDRDAFLIKVDAAGNFEWLQQTHSIPGTYTYGSGVAADVQGNAIITGNFDDFITVGAYTLSGAGNGTECFTIKYDSAGNPLWAKQSLSSTAFGGNTQGTAITSDANSNAVITGEYGDSVNFGAQGLPNFGMEVFVVMYDSSGNCNWAVASKGQNPGAFGNGISTDNNGSYYVTGFDKGPPIFGNDTLHAHVGEDILVAKLGNTIVQSIFTTVNTTVCPGTCINFTNLSLQATSYQWSFPGAIPNTSTDVDPQNICYNTSGQYDVQLIASNGTQSDTLLLSNYITIYPSPAPQAIAQSGDTLFANIGAVSYQWYFNGTVLSGATDYFYVASASGDYNVVCTDENGCQVEAAVFNVIAEVQSAVGNGQFAIYPNPVVDKCTIHDAQFTMGTAATISIYNMLGEKIYMAVDCQLPTVDCGLLPSGIYYLEVSTISKTFRTKFIKQ